MLNNIRIKSMFKNQVHERKQFTLQFKGNSYQGIFHEGKIQWFNPQPQQKVKEVESKVHELLSNHI
ncbi:DUF5342 family protein [Paenibacillus sp. FSL W8-0186]|uniref:YheE family protein n=1 Tax=Paenibacillus woosongensis TaxID=307580 RepID=A0ABQ4MLY2_9BACL|nr:DUF5342 family protein [Paenibacillus woosongensis]GIP56682.1 hypothetical protein J15TS10_04960 [Paenibacillus woosongensis]